MPTANYVAAASLLTDYDPVNETPPPVWACGPAFGETVELSPGQVRVLGAAPGVGKTAMIGQITTDALRLNPDLRVLIVNVEMTPAALLDRQLSRLSGVPLRRIRKRELTAADAPAIGRGLTALHEVAPRLSFVQPPYDMANIIATCEATDPDVIVLDYVQRIMPDGKHGSHRERVDALMTAARQLADADCCVLTVAAVSRQRNKRGNSDYGNLGLASFRETSELEFGADSAYVMQPLAGDTVRLQQVKGRHGDCLSTSYRFDGSLQTFTRLSAAEAATAIYDAAGEGNA